MSITEMKKEINSKIENLNEAQLNAVKEFIKKINSSKETEWDLKKYLNEIMDERDEVLKKLAQ
ncbi:MAG TPA: hypothetical protein VGW31_12490 [Hanamia sp.]|nr:hypothetical protein [Hanamia sp.]